MDNIDEYKDKYLRVLADNENIKKRCAIDVASASNKGVELAVLSILPVLDDFERAFNHNELAEGGKLIYKKLVDALKSIGVEKIDITDGTDFNVDEHEAISMVGSNNKVVEVVSAGYKLNGKVIRYSKVIVG